MVRTGLLGKDCFTWRKCTRFTKTISSSSGTQIIFQSVSLSDRVPSVKEVYPEQPATENSATARGSGEETRYRYGILAHELCNLFTGERVTSGWPTAWWANHRSPFPTMIANQAIRRIASQFYRAWGDYNDPLVVMFDRIYDEYRGLFPKMFQKMRELRVSLSGLEDPYLSHLVYYFMFYGAGRQLTNYFVVPPMPPINPKRIQEIEGKYHLGVI